jgi:hypothetical protein
VNKSSSNINGYVLTVGNLSITTDFASIGEVMRPGESHVERIPLSNFSADPQKQLAELVISAVSFQGYSGEGDSEQLNLLLERHRGIKEEISLLLPILKEAQKNFSPNALSRLKSVVPDRVRNNGGARVSGTSEEGREWVQKQFGKKIQMAENLLDVERVIVFYEKVLANL